MNQKGRLLEGIVLGIHLGRKRDNMHARLGLNYRPTTCVTSPLNSSCYEVLHRDLSCLCLVNVVPVNWSSTDRRTCAASIYPTPVISGNLIGGQPTVMATRFFNPGSNYRSSADWDCDDVPGEWILEASLTPPAMLRETVQTSGRSGLAEPLFEFAISPS